MATTMRYAVNVNNCREHATFASLDAARTYADGQAASSSVAADVYVWDTRTGRVLYAA